MESLKEKKLNLNDPHITRLIDLAIEEDIGKGDITSNAIIRSNETKEAVFIVKQDGIIAGLDVAKMVFIKFDERIEFVKLKKDGDQCIKGEKVASVKGNYKALLNAERTALNFLQRMSGIATKTNMFVKQLEGLSRKDDQRTPFGGSQKTKILDTRKTVPGHRILDKYAVKMGGGVNHRMGLYDMVMIKDNHIILSGGIKNAVSEIRKKMTEQIKIEVETSSLKEVEEALAANVDIIMLDNMNIEEMKKAVELCKGKVLTEASGNISIKNLRDVAETGVDYISVGELTHSVEALDISMKIID
jgi:nicotinate-nucleotide pyrophosphorylase (carboxylating)